MTQRAAITFDATGTLIHCPRLAEIYAEVLKRHAIELAPDDIAETFPIVWQELDCRVPAGVDRFSSHPRGARGFWTDLLGRLCELLDRERPSPFAVAELFERFSQAEAWEVYPEVSGVLGDLRDAGLALAVVSNWDERLPVLIERLDLDHYFTAVVVSAVVGVAKPHPVLFRRALRALGTTPDRALHVGDSQRDDVEGAIAAGMSAVRLDRKAGQDLASLELLPRA